MPRNIPTGQLSLFGDDDQPINPTSVTDVADAETYPQYTEDGDFIDPNAGFNQHIGDAVRKGTLDGVTVYSLVDICAVVIGTDRARRYWDDTKRRLVSDGFEVSDSIGQLKLKAPDGKMRLTDVADAETCLRVVQSIPSPKAEPIRQWIAQQARENMERKANPEIAKREGVKALAQRLERYEAEGRSKSWQEARLMGMMSFKDFQDRLYAACPTIKFGQAINTEYRNLWGGTAAQLRERAGIGAKGEVRDTLTTPDLHLLGYVESRCAEAFGDREYITEAEALQLIDEISSFAAQAKVLSNKAAAPRLKDGK